MTGCSKAATFIGMKRNDLTPTVITDKNGKVTTVHKKSSKATKNATLPSPRVQSPERMNELLSRAAVALDMRNSKDAASIKRFLAKIDDMAEPFVKAAEKAVADDEAGKDYGKANRSFLMLAVVDADGGLRKSLLPYLDVFPENVALTDARFTIQKIAKAFGGDPKSPEYVEQVRAHTFASANYQRPDKDDYALFDYEDNDALFNMVMRRPEDVEEIMKLHNEYKVPLITDETIEDYRNHHTSLGHGIL